MKYIIIIIPFLLLFSGYGTNINFCQNLLCVSSEHAIQNKTDTFNFDVKLNQTFTISEFSNPSTGYFWIWANQDSNSIVKLVNKKYISDKNPGRKVGVGGKMLFTFKAIKKGTQTIQLKYSRMDNQYGDSKIYYVRVK